MLFVKVRGDRHELLFLGDGLEARFDVGDARGHRIGCAVEVFARESSNSGSISVTRSLRMRLSTLS